MLDLANLEDHARNAVKTFWLSRIVARDRQVSSGRVDQGERSGVTAGKNMDGFIRLALDFIRRNGLVDADIHLCRSVVTLPGYFRPTKLWDVVVVNRGRLVAALEFKSQVGPSFGNNFNNRAEEAIGSAHDFWTAFREGAFGASPRPFLGWLMLVEDTEASRKPVRDASPHFPISREFERASYAKRYDILCQRLVQESLYSAASMLMSPRSSVDDGSFSEMSELTGEPLAEFPDQAVFFGNGRFFLIGGLDMEPSLWYGTGVTTTTYGETAPCPCDHPYQMPGGAFKGNFSRPSPGRSARWA